jgi:hypothetical protein
MKALILYVGFVVASVAAAVLIASYVELQTSPQVGTIVMLALFFTGLVVSWIATVFVMDGGEVGGDAGSRCLASSASAARPHLDLPANRTASRSTMSRAFATVALR